jgi:hypothetical protein
VVLHLLFALILAGLLLRTDDLAARDPACPFVGSAPSLLNSERIERCFGSYGIELIDSDGDLRLARLYSMDGGAPVCRTLAITEFVSDPPPELRPAMREIRSGRSIGATFEAFGWTVGKQTLLRSEVAAGARFRELAKLGALPPGTPIAVHMYRLSAERDGHRHIVAHIAEFHHPEYLSLADLEHIRGRIPDVPKPDADDARFMREVLERVGAVQ